MRGFIDSALNVQLKKGGQARQLIDACDFQVIHECLLGRHVSDPGMGCKPNYIKRYSYIPGIVLR